jgi:DNA-binding winged helix-turn-helix (wHTH) protein
VLYVFDDSTLDTERRELWRAASPVPIGPQVFDLLAYLIENRERVVSQDDLLAAVWKGRIVSESTLRSHINAARGAIGDDGEAQRLIRTLPRKGFRFVGEVRERQASLVPVGPADAATEIAPRSAVAPASERDRHVVSAVVIASAPGLIPAPTSPARWQVKNGVPRVVMIGSAVAVMAIITGLAILFLYPGAGPGVRQASVPPPVPRGLNVMVPENVPFISDRDQAAIREVYLSASDHKALALGYETMGFAVGEPDKATAEAAAVANCQKTTDEKKPPNGRETPIRCQLYASGDFVVSSRPRPPMPPQPWIVRNPSIETPFAAKDVPLISERTLRLLENSYAKSARTKVLALSAAGNITGRAAEASVEQAVRRGLELCGNGAGTACMIVEINDKFIVPIPKLMKVVGFVRAGIISDVAPAQREEVARRLANANAGWNAVAVGASGNSGLKLGAESEQAAIAGAMDDCARDERECHVVAIGPFLVEPKP